MSLNQLQNFQVGLGTVKEIGLGRKQPKAYFKVLSRHLLGETEECHGKYKSGQPLS
jgi:hypothetical protein